MSEDSNVSGEHNVEAAAPVANEIDNAPAEQLQEEQNVPLSALQSERAQRQQLQDELKMIKEHISLLQSNQQATPKEVPKDELDGLDDGDVLTVGEAKKFLSKMNKQYQMSIEELKMTQKYPDYQEVITKYLPDVLKQNPGLKSSLQKSQDYELAYYLAKNSDIYRGEKRKSNKSVDAQRIVENSQKAGSLSSMGQTSPISQAKRYKDMPDKDFKALVNKNLGGP